jgi:hypothetical protein
MVAHCCKPMFTRWTAISEEGFADVCEASATNATVEISIETTRPTLWFLLLRTNFDAI